MMTRLCSVVFCYTVLSILYSISDKFVLIFTGKLQQIPAVLCKIEQNMRVFSLCLYSCVALVSRQYGCDPVNWFDSVTLCVQTKPRSRFLSVYFFVVFECTSLVVYCGGMGSSLLFCFAVLSPVLFFFALSINVSTSKMKLNKVSFSIYYEHFKT